MSPLMSYLTGFGLASGVGAKAYVPVLALGALHHTEYFELSPQWAWIASPAVMVVLAVLTVAEIWVESDPDLAQYVDLVHYLPKAATGFIAFAAATGTVDQSLLELGASGLLGTGTAAAVAFVRHRLRGATREVFALHHWVGRAVGLGEAGVSATASLAAVVAPVLALAALAALVACALVLSRLGAAPLKACVNPDCRQRIPRQALACMHCGAEQPRT